MKRIPSRGRVRLRVTSCVGRMCLLVCALSYCGAAYPQYIGVTVGWQYSAQLQGPPTYPNRPNISLYNPDRSNPNVTWESWVEQLLQSGVDFACPNMTGSQPNRNDPPSEGATGLLNVIKARGLGEKIKLGAFDDNAASWCAQWNMANGRGYGYAQPFDISDPANWVYIYDYNYKNFLQAVPDANRFKINGRPVLIIWTGNPFFIGNAQGNLSKALLWVRQRCQEDFGFNPYIIGNADFIGSDSTCADPGVLDATHGWFGPPATPYTLSTFKGTAVGVAVPQFQSPSSGSSFLDPRHGEMFDEGLRGTVGAGALVTLLEGFTDYEEDASMWRVRNLAANGTPLTYDQTFYDYPNQRMNLIRKWSRNPVPASMKWEAEGCDTYGGAAGGNGRTNYYRNGNIAIERTTDVGTGHNIGWMQPGEWFEWQDVPLNGTPRFEVRVATPNDGRMVHLEIDGAVKASKPIPNTGGWQAWQTIDLGSYGEFAGTHTVRIVFDNGEVNFNWWQTADGTPALPIPPVVNLAYGKTAVASSSSGSLVAQNVTDGSLITRWQANTNNSAWIRVDLGAVTDITGVTLRWEFAYGRSYKIQVSDDLNTWTDVYSTTTGDGGVDKIDLNARGRYVRMQGVQRGTQYGYSFYEFEVFGPATVSVAATTPNAQKAGSNGLLTFTRTGLVQSDLTVYFTLEGDAVLGTDYSLGSAVSSVVIPAGQSSVQVNVFGIDRSLPTGNQSLSVKMDAGAGYSPGSTAAGGQILDSPINLWKIGHFGMEQAKTEIAEDSADADGDGESNLVEYALGHNPLTAGDGVKPMAEVEDFGGAGYLTYEFSRPNPAPVGVTYAVEEGGLNGVWNGAVPVAGFPTPQGDVKYRSAVPISEKASGFMRLKVTRP